MSGPSGILGAWSSAASVVSSTQTEQSLLVVAFGVFLDNTHTFNKNQSRGLVWFLLKEPETLFLLLPFLLFTCFISNAI